MSTFQIKNVAEVLRNALHLVPHHTVDKVSREMELNDIKGTICFPNVLSSATHYILFLNTMEGTSLKFPLDFKKEKTA